MFDQVASAHKWADIILRTYIITTVLSTVSVAIRFIAKLNTKAKFGFDDAFIIIAQLLCYVEAGMHIHAANLGKQLVTMLDPGYVDYQKWVTIAGMLYAPTVLCVSLSVLFFYRRIFPVQSIKRLVTVFIVAHVAWFLPTFFGSVFICRPIDLAWAPLMVQAVNAEKCIKYPYFFLSILSIELGLNAAVLVMPIKQSWGLQLNLQTRIMLVFVFMLGGISLISGIVRIQQTYVPNEPYIDLAGDMFWLAIHVNTALIAASLPIYRPLMRAGVSFMSSSIRKVYGSGYDSKRSGGSSKESKGYSSISDKQSQKSLVEKEQDAADPYNRHIQMNRLDATHAKKGPQIRVEQTFEVV